MRKSIKAIICAASAFVICAVPTMTSFAGVTANTAITASAASNDVIFPVTHINGELSCVVEAMGVKYRIVNMGSPKYAYASIEGTTAALDYVLMLSEFNNTVILPTYIKYKGVTYTVHDIAPNAFSNADIKTVDMSNCKHLGTINNFAFENSKITEISIPSYVNKIGCNAFKDCNSLQKVTIEKTSSDLYIQNKAFTNINPSINNMGRNIKYYNSDANIVNGFVTIH